MLICMNRIDRIFHELRATGGRALMPFITAGDPDLQTTADLIRVLEQAGASIVEIGIPFSDPIADGPVIQASMTYALGQGIRLSQIFEMVGKVRQATEVGLVAMVSYSIVYRHGTAAFVRDAAEAGFDGLIIPDLPLEQGPVVREAADDGGLRLAMLVAPTTPMDRAKKLAEASSGFVYVVARAGITGEQKTLPAALPDRLKQLREGTDLPLAVGFGISSGEQVRQVVSVADAAIVGSAIVRRINEHRDQGRAAIIEQVRLFTESLAGGLQTTASGAGAGARKGAVDDR